MIWKNFEFGNSYKGGNGGYAGSREDSGENTAWAGPPPLAERSPDGKAPGGIPFHHAGRYAPLQKTINEFVEKILVHERARKGSQDTTQEVEIYFNFVGRYIPPAVQPVPLTPEEQEELRKKEERKDRLHQNYLRRKANGKQKEWEAVSYTHL